MAETSALESGYGRDEPALEQPAHDFVQERRGRRNAVQAFGEARAVV